MTVPLDEVRLTSEEYYISSLQALAAKVQEITTEER
jgi:hypothetical protein